MEIKSYLMSNNEVLSAMEMFITDKHEKYGRTLEDVSNMDIEELTDRIKGIDTMIPHDIMVQLEKFWMQFESEWTICLLYLPNEVCGLIAFTDWA